MSKKSLSMPYLISTEILMTIKDLINGIFGQPIYQSIYEWP